MPQFENPPYYITAYGLAVKRGFKGTLDEWIASLQGDKVRLRYQDGKIQWRWVHNSEDNTGDTDAEESQDTAGNTGEEGSEDEAGNNSGTEDTESAFAWNDLVDIAEIRGQIVEQTLEEARSCAYAAKESAESIAGRADEIDQLLIDVADLKYVPIEITSLSNTAGTVEIGSTVDSVTVKWTLNKEPVSQTLNGEAVEKGARSATLSGLGLTKSTAFTVAVTDEREATDSETTKVYFYNGIYYGVLEEGAALDSAAILSLTRKLQSRKALTFTANAEDSYRIAYALPSRHGTPNFNVGGFDGGFSKAATITFTNASGYTEDYDLWLSDNTGLGSTIVTVT